VYQDISHAGRPYKSLLAVAGFEDDPASLIDSVSVTKGGIRHYTEEAARQLAGTLYAYKATSPDKSTTMTDQLDAVGIEPFDPAVLAAVATDATTKALVESINALHWVTVRTQAEMAVFVPFAVLWPTTDSMANMQLGAMDSKDRAGMASASAVPIGAFLTDPGIPKRDWITIAAVTVGVIAASALSAYAYKKWVRPARTLRGSLAGK
jgi:hypothetical protein